MLRRRPSHPTIGRSRFVLVGCLGLFVGLPAVAASRVSSGVEAAGSLSLGPPIYRGKLTTKKRGSRCLRGCKTTCKTLTLAPTMYQLHCNAKGYPGLVIFSGKRCKKTGNKIHCWFKNKHLAFRGSKTK